MAGSEESRIWAFAFLLPSPSACLAAWGGGLAGHARTGGRPGRRPHAPARLDRRAAAPGPPHAPVRALRPRPPHPHTHTHTHTHTRVPNTLHHFTALNRRTP